MQKKAMATDAPKHIRPERFYQYIQKKHVTLSAFSNNCK